MKILKCLEKVINKLGYMKITEHLRLIIQREDELNKVISSLKNDLKEANGNILEITLQLSDLCKEKESLQEELKAKKESLDTAMTVNKELRSENKKLKDELSKRPTITQLRAQKPSKQTQYIRNTTVQSRIIRKVHE